MSSIMNPNSLIPVPPSALYAAVLALSSAMLSGVLFVFSNFAMKAFSNIAPGAGVSAMQSINRAILNPGFLGLFAGTAAGSLAALVIAIRHWQYPASAWVAAGAMLCLVACHLVTAGINVPLNHRLDRIDPASPEAAAAWKGYIARWQPWNHVRTLASILAAACHVIGALKLAGG